MEIIGLIVVFFVIRILTSVAKKNAANKSENTSPAAAPVPTRPRALSDIQKAFDLMRDFGNEPSADDIQPQQPIVQPQQSIKQTEQPVVQAQVRESIYQRVSTAEGESSNEGLSSYEGMKGIEGTRSNEGVSRYEGMKGIEGTRSNEGVSRYEGIKGIEGTRSHEGTRYQSTAKRATAINANKDRLSEQSNTVNVRVEQSDFDDAQDKAFENSHKPESGLGLFEKQSDYAKAIIYSEILARRSPRRSAR